MSVSFDYILHLLIQVLSLLLVLEIRDELLDGLNHLRLGKVFLLKYPFQPFEETIHFLKRVPRSLANHTQRLKSLHINLLSRHIELLVCLFTSGIRANLHGISFQI